MRTAWILAVLLSTVAYGGDFCFNSTSPPNPAPPNNPDILVIAQNFKPPKKGKCKAVVGFETASISSNPPTVPRPVTGTACLNFDGSILRVGFTLLEVYDSRVNNSSAIHHTVQVAMELSYPALTGWCQVLLPDGDDLVRNTATAGPCEVPFFF